MPSAHNVGGVTRLSDDFGDWVGVALTVPGKVDSGHSLHCSATVAMIH
jgi:hypothetical protein